MDVSTCKPKHQQAGNYFLPLHLQLLLLHLCIAHISFLLVLADLLANLLLVLADDSETCEKVLLAVC